MAPRAIALTPPPSRSARSRRRAHLRYGGTGLQGRQGMRSMAPNASASGFPSGNGAAPIEHAASGAAAPEASAEAGDQGRARRSRRCIELAPMRATRQAREHGKMRGSRYCARRSCPKMSALDPGRRTRRLLPTPITCPRSRCSPAATAAQCELGNVKGADKTPPVEDPACRAIRSTGICAPERTCGEWSRGSLADGP